MVEPHPMSFPPDHPLVERVRTMCMRYPEAVDASGGLPVILPPIEPEGVGDLVSRVSGLMLSGGPDLHPSAYGAAGAGTSFCKAFCQTAGFSAPD